MLNLAADSASELFATACRAVRDQPRVRCRRGRVDPVRFG